jgi:hypothetical protein
MDIRKKYIDFMLENIIETNMDIILPHPRFAALCQAAKRWN